MSRYKLKIIFWYTSLLSAILIIVFVIIYSILNYQLRHEIDNNLTSKINKIDSWLREQDKPITKETIDSYNRRGRNSRRGSFKDKFLEYIVDERGQRFWDLQELTEVVDEKYILFVYWGDSLIYLTDKYAEYGVQVQRFQIKKNTTQTINLLDIPFTMSAIHKVGYSVYVGHELTTIRTLEKRIFFIFMFVFPFGILLSILCGYYVTQRSLKVITSITKTATKITSKNLHERIKIPSSKDEISELIDTLNSMIDGLEKSFTMVQQFSQDAAHEIRTPLTIIRGEIEELLKDEDYPENISNTLESILEEVQYLSSIADKLLLIHSLDTGKIEYNFTTINLEKIIIEIFEDSQILSSEKQLNIKLKKCEPVEIKGNEELLFRLMWNLVDNAIKYSQPTNIINLSLEKTGSTAIISVKDTGIGIPEEELPKIFDRFYRVDKSRSRELGGSGLGLSICKWIIELHHGEIKVESEVNKGSIFTVIFPI